MLILLALAFFKNKNCGRKITRAAHYCGCSVKNSFRQKKFPTFVVQEIQSTGDVMNNNAGFLLTEALPLVNLCQY